MEETQLLAWTQYVKLTVGLFAISTPFAAVPIYLSLTRDLPPPLRRRVAAVSAVTYVLTLVLFAVFGDEILAFFGITLEAFKVAGGLLLVLSALRMMRPDDGPREAAAGEAARAGAVGLAVVPLTIPILAGPAAITTVVVYTHDGAADHQLWMAVAILAVAAITFGLFRAALRLGPLLGPSAVQILNQVMGLIVASIGAEFLIEGIREALRPGL